MRKLNLLYRQETTELLVSNVTQGVSLETDFKPLLLLYDVIASTQLHKNNVIK